MPSSKHERLYGKSRKVKQVPSFAVEGGFIDDRSGQATRRVRRRGFQVRKGGES